MRLELAELMALRGNFYALLSHIYRERANALFLADLAKNKALIAALEEMAGRHIFQLEDPADTVSSQDFAELASHLSDHFGQLFLGSAPEAVSPYASAYQGVDGTIIQGAFGATSLIEIKKAYWDEGLELARDWRDGTDHVSTMFEFIELLASRTERAIDGELWQTAIEYLQKQREFLEKYIVSWVPAFCGEVFRKSQSTFYKSFALITEEFIEFDMELILRSIKELDSQGA